MARTKVPVRSYQHGNLAAALKIAALVLVRERGPSGFSLNEAARRAGVAASAPYRHFADREALLASLAVDGNALLAQTLMEAVAAGDRPLEAMVALGVAYVDFAVRHHDYFDVMFNSGINRTDYPELVEAARRSFEIGLATAKLLTPEPERQRDVAFGTWTVAHGIVTLLRQDAVAVINPRGDSALLAMTRRLLTASLSGGLAASQA